MNDEVATTIAKPKRVLNFMDFPPNPPPTEKPNLPIFDQNRIEQLKNNLPTIPETLPGLQKESVTSLCGPCPKCGGTDRFVYRTDENRFWCRQCNESGGDVIDFHKWIQKMDFKGLCEKYLPAYPAEVKTRKSEKPRIVKTYDYTDATGKLLFQVQRREPGKGGRAKDYPQQQPDGNGGWIPNMDGVKRVLYHLPDTLKADEILLVEGEKCADILRSIGLQATTAPGGAAAPWLPQYTETLKGKKVVLLPDNDEPGRKHMLAVAAALYGKVASLKWLDLPDLLEKGDVVDFVATFTDKETAAERLGLMVDGAAEYEPEADSSAGLKLVDASDWLRKEPPDPDQVLQDVLDAGDKLAIIGSSKLRKSFFLLQAALSLASGRDFLKWRIPKARRVLFCQFEIREHHAHRRVRNLARAMGITPADIGNRLRIINGRGLGITGPEGIKQITESTAAFKPEVILLDPLYKLSSGVENDAGDMKIILAEFDKLAEQAGAAIVYVHHDAKGSPGDRDIRDRGAGSNVLGRDYDACFTLTAHIKDSDAAVVDILLRNYPPQESFTVIWNYNEEGYCFRLADDMQPEKRTCKAKQTPAALITYLPIAEAIFTENNGNMDIAIFKAAFKEQTGLSDNRIRDFLNWSQAGGKPYIRAIEERGRGLYKKTLIFANYENA